MLASLAIQAIAQTTLYYDDFSGTGAVLNATVPDITIGTNAWAGSTDNFFDDGDAGGGVTYGIWLPFVPVQGNVYTLSCDLTQGWCVIGFAETDSDQGFFLGAGGYATIGYNDSTTFTVRYWPGQNKDGEVNLFVITGTPAEGKVVLDCTDPSSANWTADYYWKGVLKGSNVVAASGDYGDIQYVGLTAAGASSSAFDDFLLVSSETPVVQNVLKIPTETNELEHVNVLYPR